MKRNALKCRARVFPAYLLKRLFPLGSFFKKHIEAVMRLRLSLEFLVPWLPLKQGAEVGIEMPSSEPILFLAKLLRFHKRQVRQFLQPFGLQKRIAIGGDVGATKCPIQRQRVLLAFHAFPGIPRIFLQIRAVHFATTLLLRLKFVKPRQHLSGQPIGTSDLAEQVCRFGEFSLADQRHALPPELLVAGLACAGGIVRPGHAAEGQDDPEPEQQGRPLRLTIDALFHYDSLVLPGPFPGDRAGPTIRWGMISPTYRERMTQFLPKRPVNRAA